MNSRLRLLPHPGGVLLLLLSLSGCATVGTEDAAGREPATFSGSEKSRLEPGWLSEQPLVVVGNWDTARIFRTRRGGNPVWHEDDYDRQHTEEAVTKLKDLGVTLAIIHFYKGFGLEAERGQLEDARELASLCKKHGLRVGVYVGSTIGYETFLLEKPEAIEWFVPDFRGEPVWYSGTQTFRKRVYFMHPGFISYMKRVLQIAVQDLKADLIHFDNTSLRARRPTFYHPLARRHFREYLEKQVDPDVRESRLGFENVTYVEPPYAEEPLNTIDDPLFQLWTDFRCQTLADFYGEMADFVHSLNPEVAIDNNPHSGLSGINTMWEQGVDYPKLLASTQLVWTEEGNEAGITSDRILVSKIRTYKQAEILNNRVLTYTGDSLLQMAEAMAFNRGCLGMVGGMLAGYELSEEREHYEFDNPYTWGGEEPGFRLTESKRRYIDFLHRNFNYFRDGQGAAEVAVLHSYPTMAFSNGRPYQSTYLFEQALIQAKIPFDIVFDRHLDDLSKYKVLVLADQEALSDQSIRGITEYVRGGGGLVATEHTSLYTEWRRRRRDFGFADMFRISPPKWQARGRRSDPLVETDPIRATFGRGRVVYLPEVIPAKERPWQEPMVSTYWKLPLNRVELADAVEWAAGGGLSLKVEGTLATVAELRRLQGSRDLVLHLLNYGFETEPSAPVKVSVELPAGTRIHRVTALSPDFGEAIHLPFQTGQERIFFEVPELRVYSLVHVDFGTP